MTFETRDDTIHVKSMNVLDGQSYEYILNQVYDERDAAKWLQVDVRLDLLNKKSYYQGETRSI